MDKTKEQEVTNILVESTAEDFIAEIEYNLPHASPKDIERSVNDAMVTANVDDTEFDLEQKYALYRIALAKMRETIRSHFLTSSKN
jgi:hypothetical protein